MDKIDVAILKHLAVDARMSLKRLAAHIGLSSPSTAERIKRLEEKGIIRGYTVNVDAAALGFSVQAIVRIRPMAGQVQRLEDRIRQLPHVLECDRVAGEDCFVVRLVAATVGDLDVLVAQLSDGVAQTNTSIVKRQIIARRPPVD